ncbi:lysylphosphatidylglycerol synthase transmembrane domain-containing protein [Longibacter salinarum]|uniref:lysylphosphatidylglycerol synthase transmembrane domain-containing protein n=1 Tax=Longibacter salinarum TaxID=1850348 RepID=UPI0015CF304D|nr:lysylphosphatidylglycerol synthase transmembrane domain-containing protein [Longibacter salinarum]
MSPFDAKDAPRPDHENDGRPDRSRVRIRQLARLLFGVGLLVAIVLYVDVQDVWFTLRQADPTFLTVALFLVVPNVWLDAWSWGVVLRPLSGGVARSTLVRATLAGYAVGFFTPARLGEFAGRALALRHRDMWTVSVTVFAQRLVDMLVAVTVGLGLMTWARFTGVIGTAWDLAIAVGAGVALLFMAAILWPDAIDKWARRMLPRAGALHERTSVLHDLENDAKIRLLWGCLTRYIVFAGQMTILVKAFDPSAEWSTLVAGSGLMYYFKYLIPSLTLLDVGIREGAAVLVYGWLGVAEAAALNAALTVFVFNITLPAVVGGAFVRLSSSDSDPDPNAPDRNIQRKTSPT